jgi:phospho-N-acetylmuramoyl-pentapeptide-transferase
LLLSWWLGPRIIGWLRELKFGQQYADKAEESGSLKARVIDKRGTPTMGGILIVLAMDLSALLWAQWNELVLLTLLSLIVLAGLGFYDDYAKITQQSNLGAKSYLKLAVQTFLALGIAIYLWKLPSTTKLVTEIMVPFYKNAVLTGAAGTGIVLITLTIVGSSNAVNLTDGLDGLAIGCTLIVSLVFLVLTHVASNS